MSQIFISYSRADKKIADKFVSLLRRVYGHDEIWLDEEIHGGSDWWQAILQNIGECDLFIFLASHNSLDSPYCQAEFREAMRLQKLCLPVLIRKTPYPGPFPDELRPFLSKTQYVDLSDGFKRSDAAAPLFAAVNMQLEQVPAEPSPPLTETPTAQPTVTEASSKRLTRLFLGVAAVIGIVALVIGATVWGDHDGGTPWPVTTMIEVPAGPFTMGSDDADLAPADAQPAHTVDLDTYWIDQYEVTNAQYSRFVDAGYATAPWDTADAHYPAGQDDYPVTGISWDDANVYCKTVNKRLPTEAEWEKAARGTEALLWPWGNEWDAAKANTGAANLMDAQPVGSYHPAGDSPYGVSDMTGNVAEWVGDWYHADYYSNSPASNPEGPPYGETRVVRGGSWRDAAALTYTFYRQGIYPPFVRDVTIGFRCASDTNVR